MARVVLVGMALAMMACGAAVESVPEEECEGPAKPTIPLPADCWLAPDCTEKTMEAQRCGRAYVCDVEQPSGDYAPVCITAWDCDCLDELAECGPVDEPKVCALQ